MIDQGTEVEIADLGRGWAARYRIGPGAEFHQLEIFRPEYPLQPAQSFILKDMNTVLKLRDFLVDVLGIGKKPEEKKEGA